MAWRSYHAAQDHASTSRSVSACVVSQESQSAPGCCLPRRTTTQTRVTFVKQKVKARSKPAQAGGTRLRPHVADVHGQVAGGSGKPRADGPPSLSVSLSVFPHVSLRVSLRVFAHVHASLQVSGEPRADGPPAPHHVAQRPPPQGKTQPVERKDALLRARILLVFAAIPALRLRQATPGQAAAGTAPHRPRAIRLRPSSASGAYISGCSGWV